MINTELAGAVWRKSSYSATSGECVEVGRVEWKPLVGVRDSKAPYVELKFSSAAWDAMLNGLVCNNLTCE